VEGFQRGARLFVGIPDRLIQEYRQAPVQHADEPGGRRHGHNGETWLWATARLRLCLCRQTRAASVPQHVFGKSWLPGCLVVDRDGSAHTGLGALPDGSSPLRREVQALATACPAAAVGQAFGSTVTPPLALAMGLRAQPRSELELARQAAALQAQRMASREAPAQHLGVRRLQESCRAQAERHSPGAEERRVPAEHTLIARKVRCGSHSGAGARPRGILMSVLHTLKKRQGDVVAHLKRLLDQLAIDTQDPFPLLCPTDSP
jgi:transposase